MTNPPDAPFLLTAEETADLLRIGRTTVYALMRDGALPYVHIGRCRRIALADVQRFVTDLAAQHAEPERPRNAPQTQSRSPRPRRTSQHQGELFLANGSTGVA